MLNLHGVLFAWCGRRQYRQPGDAYHVPIDMCVLTTMEGVRVSIVLATKVILVFSLMASLGKYAFSIQNPYLYLLIVV